MPFRGTPEPWAHPSRLEIVGALNGLSPAPPASARVLELGCGTGANLLPLALEHPGAIFTGCDLAASAVASARDVADALGLTNVELRHADVGEVDDGWGAFDYIVCHDVFSWVAPNVRETILGILARHLAPQGVAFLSHDVLPGWHLHDAVLDLVRDHVRDVADAGQRIEAARAWIAAALQAQDGRDGEHVAATTEELCLLGTVPDDHLYHMIAGAAHHRAFHLHELLHAIEAAQLSWLGDADVPLVGNGSESSHRERQQHRDFAGNRSFRRAVLCRADAHRGRARDCEVIRRSWVALARSTVLTTHDDGGELCLVTSGGRRDACCATDRDVREALRRLDRERPGFVPCAELFAPDHDAGIAFLGSAFAAGAVDLVLSPFTFTTRIGDTPTATSLARLEAGRGAVVTNRRCEPVRLNEPMRFVLGLLDGRHDLAALERAIDEGRAHDDSAGGSASPFAGLAMTSRAIADHCVGSARDHALLIDQRDAMVAGLTPS